jgi:Acetyltransferases, including N-acetylases of ribosomal proteins
MTSENLSIRRASVVDARSISRIINEGQGFFFYGTPPYSSEQDWRESIEHSTVRGQLFLVAECSGKVIGLASISTTNCLIRKHTAGFSIIVSTAFHRQGVGRRLVKAVKDMAFNWHAAHRLELEVMQDNAGAISLYKSEGFSIEGIRREAIYRNGQYCNIVIMSLLRSDFTGL